jgi:hypothetical protein
MKITVGASLFTEWNMNVEARHLINFELAMLSQLLNS